MTSPKKIEAVYVIEKDVDTDVFTQREKENTCAIPASRENISTLLQIIDVLGKSRRQRRKTMNMLKMRK